MLDEIQGMLSMSKSAFTIGPCEGGGLMDPTAQELLEVGPLSTGLTQGLAGPRGRIGPTPTLKRPTPFGSAASRMQYCHEEDLEESLLKECHADDYVYPGLEASDDGASRVQTSGAMSETRHGIPKPSLLQTAQNHHAPHERERKRRHKSKWVERLPINYERNRPLSPRVGFRHFDKSDFGRRQQRLLGLREDAITLKIDLTNDTPHVKKEAF
ncbi:hypothetical protein HPB49_004350 [Dermacentor silvarum]|uniref:Uncharacterized protein n=1 Tax=Dermacentor silvarum TaxID=543639 RepID=A0ACB8DU88_DERSI|nr:hypothetical protein HPB49_004350 [Dermacentor silvarum]